jgi:hypothetical protein
MSLEVTFLCFITKKQCFNPRQTRGIALVNPLDVVNPNPSYTSIHVV